jgi:transposase-like protein
MESWASLAEVTRSYGVNTNQVFKWHRAFDRGDLVEPGAALLPVRVSSSPEPDPAEPASETHAASAGAIHIELPGRAMISVECGTDAMLMRCILESLGQ